MLLMDGRRKSRRDSNSRLNFRREICRQFVNGSCSFGQHCFYLHEYPAASSAQVCRYFQKGGCWFGENCRYLHIAGPYRGSSAVRRGSVPVVNTSTLPGHGSASLRGSEPSLFPVFDPFNSGRRGSEPMVTFNWRRRASEPLVTTSSHQQISQRETADIAEEEEHAVLEAGSTVHQQKERLQPLERDNPSLYHLPCNSQDKSTSQESGATASNPGLSMAYNESKDVVCGICMDKVYEKATARERRFGILPNCSHAFCLGCIMTWRKTKDFQEEVIKACPQCRVRSSFYIPSKYWVCEGEAKEALIASFKEKSSKIKCNFFMRHGCCPFALECIYSHELPPGHQPQGRFRQKNALEMLEDMDNEEQGLLVYLISLVLLDDDEFDFIQIDHV